MHFYSVVSHTNQNPFFLCNISHRKGITQSGTNIEGTCLVFSFARLTQKTDMCICVCCGLIVVSHKEEKKCAVLSVLYYTEIKRNNDVL